MFTLAGWSQSITSTALIAINAINDPHLAVTGTQVRIPPFASRLLGVYPMGVNLARCQMQAPSLLSFAAFEVAPVDQAATPSNLKFPPQFLENAYELVVNEPLQAFVANVAAGANIARALAFLGDSIPQPVSGEILTVRATATATLVAETWTNSALTFASLLPAGRYAICGMRAESATLIAARLVIPGYGHRPGCIGNTAVNLGFLDPFRYGNLGRWGEFVNTAPPTVDFWATAGDVAETVWLDIMQIG